MSKEALKMGLEALQNAWLDASMGKGDVYRHNEAIKAIEEALAKPEQGEPVSDPFDCGTYVGSHLGKEIKHSIGDGLPAQKPLTDEHIKDVANSCMWWVREQDILDDAIELARAIEAAHGIKE